MRRFLCLLLFAISGISIHAQPVITNREYPQNYFRNPLGIAPQASGTFGELRATHFHAGDDYRTQQRVGLPLFAVADGYVSRVRVQIGGGGHSLYINHPNGYTSVYMHMDAFNPALANLVRDRQHADKRFDVDIQLAPQELLLKKGDRIGLAGNTGSSQGPHLHFELRDTETQNPLNTQLFGLKFPDNIPPTIHGITIYDLGDDFFDEHTPRRHQKLKNVGAGRYELLGAQPISVNGRFGIGINTNDRHNGTTFNNGVYSIELLLDGKPITTVLFEELSFESSRAIHAYVDYPHYVLSQARIQKSFKSPNNPINIFHHLVGDGTLNLTDQETHTLTYRVRDVHGNTSTLDFRVRNDKSFAPERKRMPGTAIFQFDRENSFSAENIDVVVPENALYDPIYFNYSQSAKPKDGHSLVQHVHNRLTPLFHSYELRIRVDGSLPEWLRDKALIVDTRRRSQGGTFQDGMVRTTTRSFGSFYVAVDTVPPTITPQNISNGRNMTAVSRVNFKISDDLSGIQSFNGYINEQWVLMEYDAKTNSLWHVFDPTLPKGSHSFKLVVTDWKNNERIFQANFLR